MNFAKDQERIAAYYDRLAKQYGHAPQAADAGSLASLEVRYRALAEVTDLSAKKVLDVGCGFGGLGVYLFRQYPNLDYTGIDVSARMIGEGRATYPELALRQQNVLDLPSDPTYDVVLAQGIFYLLTGDADTKAQRLIRQMFALAREAVAFCAISTWSERQDPDEFRVDPVQLLAWCRRLSPRLTLRHDYHPGDVTMYLYKIKNNAQDGE